MAFRLGGGRSIQLSYRGEWEGEKPGRRKPGSETLFPGAIGWRQEKASLTRVFSDPVFPLSIFGGAEENRTPDLRIANATLSQLSYGPGR